MQILFSAHNVQRTSIFSVVDLCNYHGVNINPITLLCYYLKGSLITVVDYPLIDHSTALVCARVCECLCVYARQAEKSVCVIAREGKEVEEESIYICQPINLRPLLFCAAEVNPGC